MSDPVDGRTVTAALVRSPAAAVLVFPRSDGRYPDEATNVVGLFDEAGVGINYATDPVAAGNYTYKSAEILLPAVVIALAQVGDVVGLIEGFVRVVKYYLGRRPKAGLRMDVGVAEGDSVRWARIEVDGPPGEAEQMVRDVLDRVLRG